MSPSCARAIARVGASIAACLLLVGQDVPAAERGTGATQGGRDSAAQLEVGGYTYLYEKVAVPVAPGAQTDPYHYGKITIRSTGQGTVLYQERIGLQPGGCAKSPVIWKLPADPLRRFTEHYGVGPHERWIAILCGSTDYRHQTIKVFIGDPPSGLRATALEFGDTIPNLTDLDGDGRYEAKVFRRILWPELGFLQDYLQVYRLLIDHRLFGFVPVYGSAVKHVYREEFDRYKNAPGRARIASDVGPMLAALLATQDTSMICGELGTLTARGVTVAELERWQERLGQLGFPGTDFSKCVEVTR